MFYQRRKYRRNIKPFCYVKRRKSQKKLISKDDKSQIGQNLQELSVVNNDYWQYLKCGFTFFLRCPIYILKFVISIPLRIRLTVNDSLEKEINDMKKRLSHLEITIEKIQQESLQHINNNVTVAMQHCCNHYHGSSSSGIQTVPPPPPPLPPPPPPPPPPSSLKLTPFASTPIIKKKFEEKGERKDLKFIKLHAVTLEELRSVKLRKTASSLKMKSSCNIAEIDDKMNNNLSDAVKLKLTFFNNNSCNENINQSMSQNEERNNLNFQTTLKPLDVNKNPSRTVISQDAQYGDVVLTPPAIQVARKIMKSRSLFSPSKKANKENSNDSIKS